MFHSGFKSFPPLWYVSQPKGMTLSLSIGMGAMLMGYGRVKVGQKEYHGYKNRKAKPPFRSSYPATGYRRLGAMYKQILFLFKFSLFVLEISVGFC